MLYVGCVQDGRTPLHWAARKGHSSTVEVLVVAGADVAAVDSVSYGSGRRYVFRHAFLVVIYTTYLCIFLLL